jgi:hypothetical protein
MIAYFIDAKNQTIVQVELESWSDFKTVLGCKYIESAARWDNGDCIYVDEEGFLKPQEHYFRIAERPDQPFAGNGLLVGEEEADEASRANCPPVMTIDELRARVTFVNRAIAVELLRARPNAIFYNLNDGTSEIVSTWDDMLKQSRPPGSKV